MRVKVGVMLGGLIGVMAMGCASDPGRDLRASGVVGYPGVVASDLLAGLAKGMRGAFTPFRERRPRLLDDPPSEEQRAALEQWAVELPSSAIEIPQQDAFGVAREFIDAPALPLIATVEHITQRQFRWYLSDMLPGVGMAYPGGVIVLNLRNIAESRDAHVQTFILLHEAGHHVLGHLTRIEVEQGVGQTWSHAELELEADEYAARMMIERGGFRPYEIKLIAMRLFASDQPATHTHPSDADRLAAIRRIAEEYERKAP